MKIERERDIPAFKGKSWRERIALRDQAKELDHWIIWVQILICFFTYAPILDLSHWPGMELFPHRPFTAFVIIYLVLTYPVFTLLCAVFVTPRIRKALESDVEPSA
jgi:hypothetical protein